MKQRHTQSCEGIGSLDDIGTEQVVSYVLQEYQDDLDDLPGMKEIRGRISLKSGSLGLGNLCILRLQDGRKLRVFIESDSGQVRATGGFF